MVTQGNKFTGIYSLNRGGVAGPAGPAKAGPLFSGSLVPFSDCRDSLSHSSSEDETIGPGSLDPRPFWPREEGSGE